MNSLKWHLINNKEAKRYFGHYVYINVRGDVALADHSVTNFLDPSTQDDGLLVWTGDMPKFNWVDGYALVPIYKDDDTTASIPVSLLTVLRMSQALGKNLWPDNEEWPFAVRLKDIQDFYFANLKTEVA
jgi:hypothetical protein